MKLTILGKYGPFPAPGGCCSGYLVEADELSVMLDMGSGTFARLFQLKPSLMLNAVLLSHLHSDHIGDMLIYRYALQHFSARGMNVTIPIPVLAPDEPADEYRRLTAAGIFDVTAIKDGMHIHIGNMTVRFDRVLHTVPSYCMTMEYGGRKLVYTGDTGYQPELTNICRGADLLLADTCLLSADKTTQIAAHLTAFEAGMLARDAGVGRLVCTHIWGGGTTTPQVQSEARQCFPTAEVAEEGLIYDI